MTTPGWLVAVFDWSFKAATAVVLLSNWLRPLQLPQLSQGLLINVKLNSVWFGLGAILSPSWSNQYYDICIRRTRSYCSVCYSPVITSTTIQSSYGIGGSSLDPAQTAAVGSVCTGVTTFSSTEGNQVAYGDYLEIAALQAATGTASTVGGTVSR